MVGSPTSVGDVLSLIGNSPVLHASQSAVENLRHAKSTFPMFGGGDMSTMMTTMMSNPASLLTNAMGSISGQLTSMIGGMTGQLTSLMNGTGLGAGLLAPIVGGLPLNGTDPATMIAALTGANGLQAAVTAVTALAGGYASPLGALTLTSLSGISQAMPDTVSLDAVLGPIITGPSTSQDIYESLPATVNNGDVAGVQALTAQINAIITAHNAAVAQANNASTAIAAVGSLTYALSTPGPLGDAMQAMLSTDAHDAIMAHVQAVSDMIASAHAKATTPLSNVGATV